MVLFWRTSENTHLGDRLGKWPSGGGALLTRSVKIHSMHRWGSNVILPPPRKRRVRILMKQSVLVIATLLFGVLAGLGLTLAQAPSSHSLTTLATKPNILFCSPTT